MVATPLPPPPGPFELSGGALCLDLVNTWGDRGRPETDRLGSFADLLAFARQVEILDAPAVARLARRAAADPGAANAALDAAREVRECLYRIFAAQARDRALDAADLTRFNAALGDAHAHLRLSYGRDGFVWTWDDRSDSLAAPLWAVSRSAAALLTSTDLARVRECDGSACTWLFLDRSRGRSRRWCSMESCGNRAKARRHYQRSRQGGEPVRG